MLAHYPTVGAVTDALLSALETNGYVERSFYRTPHGGVALVTRLERINDDGSPVADATRWPASSRRDDSTASLYRFLMGLFYVDPGRYRVIVFVLQNLPFAQSPQNVTSEDARAWLGGGANVLVGGSNQTLTLQPVSVQAQTGVNIAVGVSQFSLTAVAD